MKRIIKGMNFDWYFSKDFKKEYLKKGFNFQNNEHINIPHTMKELPFSYFNELESQFTGTYFKELSIEEESLDNQLFLKFYGVMNSCDIYLNSKKVKSHEGGYVPFEFLINEYVTPGKNLLMVIVNGKETKDIPPFGGLVDYLPFSGIYREVYLMEKANVHIENAYFFSDDINILEKDKMLLNFKVILNQEANDLKLKLKVLDDDNIIYENIFSEEITNENVLQAEIEGIIRWEIDNPKLYNLELTLLKGEEEIDSLTEQVQRLETELEFAEAAKEENMRLQALLGFTEEFPQYLYVPAKIIASDPNSWFMEFTINRGANQGIVVNSAVVNEDGLVGRVIEVYPNSSKVLSIIDPQSAVPVVAQRSRDNGIAGGGIDPYADEPDIRMSYLQNDADLVPGDIVVSSSLMGIFPMGIVVGEVKEVVREDSSEKYAIITPSVDFAHLENLLIIIGKTNQEIIDNAVIEEDAEEAEQDVTEETQQVTEGTDNG